MGGPSRLVIAFWVARASAALAGQPNLGDWSLTENVFVPGESNEAAGYYTLTPPDHRPPINLRPSVAERVLRHELSPEQAYLGVSGGESTTSTATSAGGLPLAGAPPTEPGAGSTGGAASSVSGGAPTGTSTATATGTATSTATSTSVAPDPTAVCGAPPKWPWPRSPNTPDTTWANGPAADFPSVVALRHDSCASICTSESATDSGGRYYVGSKRFEAYEDYRRCVRLQCELKIPSAHIENPFGPGTCSANFEGLFTPVWDVGGNVANYGVSAKPPATLVPDGPTGFASEDDCARQLGAFAPEGFCAASVRMTQSESHAKADDPIEAVSRSYAWDMFAAYNRFFLIHFPQACAKSARELCGSAIYMPSQHIGNPMTEGMFPCLAEHFASLPKDCREVVQRMDEKDQLMRQCNFAIARAFAAKGGESHAGTSMKSERGEVWPVDLRSPADWQRLYDVTPNEEHCIWAAINMLGYGGLEVPESEPDEPAKWRGQAAQVELTRYFGTFELYLRASGKKKPVK